MSEYDTTTGAPAIDGEQLSSGEVTDTLTGFDELAIAKRFGAPVEELAATSDMRFLRSLLFIVEKRNSGDEGKAYDAAMSMPFGELRARFKIDDTEPGVELPGSAQGEGNG